jgi:hypothetical protein
MSQKPKDQQPAQSKSDAAPAPQQQNDEASRNAEKQFREGIKHASAETVKPRDADLKPDAD